MNHIALVNFTKTLVLAISDFIMTSYSYMYGAKVCKKAGTSLVVLKSRNISSTGTITNRLLQRPNGIIKINE